MKQRILLFEDNHTSGETLKEILSVVGHDVVWAKDPKDGLKQYLVENLKTRREDPKKHPFDLVLLDFAMPEFSGIDVAKGILMVHPQQRIVFCTAYPKALVRETPDFEKGIEIIEKPVSLEELQAVVEGNTVTTLRELDAKAKTEEDDISELEVTRIEPQ